jgi:hypothetical protein
MSESKRRTLQDFPAVQEAFKKVQELRAEAVANQKRIDWLTAEISRRGTKAFKDQSHTQKALGLLGKIANRDVVDQAALEKELTERQAQVPVLAKAEELASQELQRATREASKAICADALPEYKAICQEQAVAATSLARANERAKKFVQDLEAEGVTEVTATFYPLWNIEVGRLDDPGSPVSRLFREAKEHKLISLSWTEKLLGVAKS